MSTNDQQLPSMEKFRKIKEISGNYIGIILDNSGNRGRCKIFVPQVFPDELRMTPDALPWATPAMPLYGGSFTSLPSTEESKPLNAETGACLVPHVGAHVWVFFENNNHLKPVYFAAVQSGDGWLSQNRYQAVFNTDNVSIRIDDSPDVVPYAQQTCASVVYNKDSLATNGTAVIDAQNYGAKGAAETTTMWGNSFNPCAIDFDKTVLNAQGTQLNKMPLRVEITVKGNVQLVIKGHANISVEGNTYMETQGDMYNTVHGDKYERIKGNSYTQIDGMEKTLIHKDKQLFVEQNVFNSIDLNSDTIICGTEKMAVGLSQLLDVGENRQVQVGGDNSSIVDGSEWINVLGEKQASVISGIRIVNVGADDLLKVSGNSTTQIVGNSDLKVDKDNTIFVSGMSNSFITGPGLVSSDVGLSFVGAITGKIDITPTAVVIKPKITVPDVLLA